ncbi:MAG: lipoate-protein ligase A related protein [Blastopirellula sp.]|nr:MAG: lipoate-protein ligase A related protein [Blastopirellula sp.]
MKFLDLTLDQPAENLALDEALLLTAEQSQQPLEVLRLWQPVSPIAVIGRASKIEQEVDLVTCKELGVPVLRRSSGGAAIVTGAGCLMYAVVLSYELRPHLKMLDVCHREVLGTLKSALDRLMPGVSMQGTCDLTWKNQKFSGNSLRCKRTHLLYHGTLLCDFPLELISQCLKRPPKVPNYRENRDHESFVTNLPVSIDKLRTELRSAWNAAEAMTDWPESLTAELVAEKYSQAAWNHQR